MIQALQIGTASEFSSFEVSFLNGLGGRLFFMEELDAKI